MSGGDDLILVVDDDAGTRKVCDANLSLEGFTVACAGSGTEALAQLDRLDPMAAVVDLRMPDMTGIQFMERARRVRPSLPIILVTAHASVDTAVESMRQGALHYLTKPIQFDELALLLRQAVAGERARRDVVRLQGELERASGFEEVVHGSDEMAAVLRLVEQVATTAATVLVRGETGTGKELVARGIHRLSPRRDKPFVAVNCSAIPHELMESEFFGHEKGAFTGAATRRLGRFEQANGSTLFLDEAGELDLSTQAKLLRVLQEGEFTRVGGDRPLRTDVRVVAATNRDLEAAVEQGKFREDLYYRLNVIPIRLPPLRDRGGDIRRLMEHFLSSFATRYGRAAVPPPPPLLAAAEAYGWPGNVRELRNVCERAVLMGWPAVAPLLVAPRPAVAEVATEAEFELPLLEAKQALGERFEREYLTRLLTRHRGKSGEVARAAGLAERNLYEKLQRYGLNRNDFKPPRGRGAQPASKQAAPKPAPVDTTPAASLDDNRSEPSPATVAAVPPAPAEVHRRVVLVVDDSPTARALLRGYLRDSQTEILEARDGQEGLQIVQSRHVDVAVVDQRMPHLTGAEFVERVRASARTRALPVLVVTGDTELDAARLCRAGANAVLLKPVAPGALRERVAQITAAAHTAGAA